VDYVDHGAKALMQFAIEVIRHCGCEAMAFYGHGRHGVKFDEELVTKAEWHLRQQFEKQIHKQFPQHQLFNGKVIQDEYAHDETRYLWIFDPLDGVSNFLAGIPIWGMSLALLENFWPVLGVFHMPATGDIFYARADDTAYWGTQPIHISPQNSINDESLLLIYSRFHRTHHTNFPGKIRNLGCTGAHICYVAMGRAEAAFVNDESYQDLAAAQIILKAAGGNLYRTDGSILADNAYIDGNIQSEHLLAASPPIDKQVLGSIRNSI
jgi:myo-inositol-1(or 4)-monophosphatase